MSTPIPRAAALLRTLGDETRLTMLALLQRREFCVCELVALFPVSQPAISGHLRRLKDGGLVQDDRRGMWVYYRAGDAISPLAQAVLDEVELPPHLEAAAARDAACPSVDPTPLAIAESIASAPTRRRPARPGSNRRATE